MIKKLQVLQNDQAKGKYLRSGGKKMKEKMILKRTIFLTMISMIVFLFLILGITGSADTVFVDDDYYYGGANDGHIFGVDAFNKIQDGINAGGL
ncbi:MAG: hypothetical protein K8R68_08410, partial [Bacteroidales bacterium]|nr:hypothetical protein [Bacteroidales bacterium]